MIKIELIRKDHYLLEVRGIKLGEFERSQLRELIEVIDHQI